MSAMKKLLMLVSVVAFSAFALAGCNTIKGVGEDVSAGGHALSTAATDVQKKGK